MNTPLLNAIVTENTKNENQERLCPHRVFTNNQNIIHRFKLLLSSPVTTFNKLIIELFVSLICLKARAEVVKILSVL
jgi:hypothetical protein